MLYESSIKYLQYVMYTSFVQVVLQWFSVSSKCGLDFHDRARYFSPNSGPVIEMSELSMKINPLNVCIYQYFVEH